MPEDSRSPLDQYRQALSEDLKSRIAKARPKKTLLKSVQAWQGKAALRQSPGPNAKADEAVFTHSDDYRSIRFNGKNHTVTHNQGEIIRILHEAFQRGTPCIGKAKLLDAVRSETSRVQDFFRGSPLWKTLVIGGNRKGTYRLNLPTQE
jgi:hypothetical protein